MELQNSDILQLYHWVYLSRRFEERLTELFSSGKVAGWVHSCLGQEATGAVLGLCLQKYDYLVPYHRSRASLLARGLEPKLLLAEIMGRSSGPCHGKGGEAHVAVAELGILGSGGILGSNIPMAVGIAYACRLRQKGQVVVCSFGEGTSNRGAFHEALNMAAIWDLPVIFLCENNLYAEFTPWSKQTKLTDVAARSAAYGIPGMVVDGTDVFGLYDALSAAVDRARQDGGPTLVEAKTYRWHGHFEGDPARYRPAEEVEEWKKRDPVLRLEQAILGRSIVEKDRLDAMKADVEAAVEEAVVFAMNSLPTTDAEALADVYA